MTPSPVAMQALTALGGGGECGEIIRGIDWSQSPLGPIESWPVSLKSVLGILLHSRNPMFLFWGPELIQFYNDAYLPTFGSGNHAQAMGKRGADTWVDVWQMIGPQIDDVMQRGIPSFSADRMMTLFRNGRVEEGYWTSGYSPVFDDQGAIGGTLVVCTETTARVVGERRLRMLRMLSEKTALATDRSALNSLAGEVFEEASNDLAFVIRCDQSSETGAVETTLLSGVSHEHVVGEVSPRVHPALQEARARDSSSMLTVNVPESKVLGRAWPEAVSEVFIEPMSVSSSGVHSFLVFGLSPRLPFDQAYRDYVRQIREQLERAEGRIDGLVIRAIADRERDNLLYQAPVATAVMIGPNHVFQLANPMYCQFVGRDNLIGQAYAEAFPELRGTPLIGILDRVYRTGESFVTNEMLVPLSKNGGPLEDCYFQFTLQAMRDVAGHVYGMMAVVFEMTAQVRARHALEQTNREHERLLHDLERANRIKDEFLAMLGHELRNPLSPIVTALELIRLRPGPIDTSHDRRELDIIARQVAHLTRLVDDLLDVSNLTRGKVTLKKEIVEIALVVSQAVESTSHLFESRNHRLDIDIETGLSWRGDPPRLTQVLVNLLTNAARFTPLGGAVALRAFRDSNDIVLSVKDNGVGIPADMLSNIFDVFTQGYQASDRREGGLGIGLALVKNLVTMHEGTVVAISRGLDQGSEFVVRLPAPIVKKLPTHDDLKPVAPASSQSKERRVLIVDDNEDSAEMLSEMLQMSGHTTKVVNNPLDALSVASEFNPDVALLDIGLPGMDGYELARRLKEKPELAGCRLIAVTGYGQDSDKARSRASGFELHMVKPVDLATLIRAVAGTTS